MSPKAETIGAGVEKMKISLDHDNLIPTYSLRSNKENEHPHFVFLSTTKKVTGV